MSRHRSPGRRRAPGPVRRFPDGIRRLGAAYAAKTVAGVAVVGGAATMLALPASGDATPLDLATPEAGSLDSRQAGAALTASRSRSQGTADASKPAAAAITAPTGVGPVAPTLAGVSGVKAVPKPTPKPVPKPAASSPTPSTSSETTSPSSTATYSGGVSSYCSGIGVDQNAAILCSAIRAKFGELTVGGYRAGAGEHGTGEAIDIMTSDQALGDAISEYVFANASTFDVEYVIWRQRYRPVGGSWEFMEDRGSTTENHYDHVHITVN
ncbi:MAG: hypothetical protein ACRCXL_05655 [Dermatophilaceae bacterium]